MLTDKVGNFEFSVEYVRGKTLTQLKGDFPHVRDELLREVAKKYSKKRGK